MRTLQDRPYQVQLMKEIVDDWHGRNEYGVKITSTLIELPPGSGKTLTAFRLAKMFKEQASAIAGWDPKDVGIGWIAGRRNLLKQAEKENESLVQCDDVFFVSQFATDVHDCGLYDFKHRLLVVDEAHHEACSTMHNIINAFDPGYMLGLSATPIRTDRAKLCFQKNYKTAGFYTLIDEGWLADFDHWNIPNWTPEMVVTRYLDDPEHWGKSIMFFRKREDCQEAVSRLKAAGVRVDLVTGETDRDAQLAAFENDELDVLVNMFVLTEGFDCLSEDTEILTTDGWKGYEQVSETDMVYALNLNDDTLEVVDIDGYGVREISENEKMINFKSQHVDILVTENHKIYYQYRSPNEGGSLNGSYLVKNAKDFVNRRSSYSLPLAPGIGMVFDGIPLTDDEIRLVAWHMTDGWIQNTSLCIGQSKTKELIDDIRNLLDRLCIDYIEYTDDNRRSNYTKTPKKWHEFQIPKGTSKAQPRNGWGKLEEYLDKKFSSLLHGMTIEQFEIFWLEALKGDGNKSRENSSGWLWCEHKETVDELMKAAILRGKSSSCASFKCESGKTIWRVSVRNRTKITSDPIDQRAGKINDHVYSGKVWCIKNRLNTIVTRRNGKVAIIGNCPELRTVFVRDSGRLPTIQMAGRVLRPHENIPVTNIVQSTQTKWPFTRTANIAQRQMVWQDDHWERIDRNENIDRIARNTIKRLAESSLDDSNAEVLKKLRAVNYKLRRGRRRGR